MKMRHWILSILPVVALAISHPAAGQSLRDQLALAEKDEDTYAQIELIRRILDKGPEDPALREQLATLWLSVEDFDLAESTLHGWKEPPDALRVHVLATVLFVRDGKRNEAVAMLEDYLARHPDDLEATRQLVGYLEVVGESRKIIDLLGKTPGMENDAGLLVSRALAQRKSQDFAAALRDFQAAERADSEDEKVVNQRPSFDRLRASLAGINAANAVLSGKSDDVAALVSRAYWYLATGSADEPAFADAEAASRLDAHSVAALILYAEASNRTRRLSAQEARQKLGVDVTKPVPTLPILDRLWRLDVQVSQAPKDVSVLLARSRALNSDAQQSELALRDAEAALAMDPRNSEASAVKISALAKLGKLEEAATELRALETLKPSREVLAEALGGVADAALSASQLELALEFSDRAIRADPKAEYYKQRAAILQRLERFSDAQSDLAQARQLDEGKSP